MAQQTTKIGGFGPFLFDDAEEKAIETEGEIQAGSFTQLGLSTNIRLLLSNANKQVAEADDLTIFIISGNGITVVDELDGTVSIDLDANIDDINDVLLTTEADGQVLMYDSGTSNWVNADIPAQALAALADVAFSTVATDDILVRNLANDGWVNYPAVKNIAVDDTQSPYSLSVDALNVHVFCDCTNGAITINLPPVATLERATLFITKKDNVANNVTITADGTETINGAASIDLSQQWDNALIVTDGTEWYAKV